MLKPDEPLYVGIDVDAVLRQLDEEEHRERLRRSACRRSCCAPARTPHLPSPAGLAEEEVGIALRGITVA